MSNPLQQIKARQIADAIEKGEANPYETSAAVTSVAEPALNKHNKLHQIKAKQLIDTPELYERKEVVIGSMGNLDGNLFEQLKAAMVTDIARIKLVKKLEEKQAIKADLLPGYLPFVLDYVEQGHDYPNSVAVQVMVWLFDTNDIEQGLKLGLYLISLGNQSLPPKFNRTLNDFICDAVYDWANEQLKTEQSASPYLDQLLDVISNDEWDLHPAVHSKLLAMMAKHTFAQDNVRDTVVFCEQAEAVNPEGAGVKTLKGKAQKKLDELAAQESAE